MIRLAVVVFVVVVVWLAVIEQATVHSYMPLPINGDGTRTSTTDDCRIVCCHSTVSFNKSLINVVVADRRNETKAFPGSASLKILSTDCTETQSST
jgi:hypothetical protein